MRPTILVAASLALAGGRGDSPKAALLAADRAAATGIGDVLAPDAVYLHDGAPIARGRARIRELLAAAYDSTRSLRRRPAFADVSADGGSGYTYGWTELTRDSGAEYGKYLACWRRSREGGGSWWVTAYVQSPIAVPPPPDTLAIHGPSLSAPPRLPRLGRQAARAAVLRADRAFAALSVAGGAKAAFTAYAAPGAVVIGPEGQLRRGPAAVGGAFDSAPPGYRLEWEPLIADVAESADLGCTIGEATASAPAHPDGVTRSYSKYLTVWQRQPDGTWRYVADMGNRRPPPPTPTPTRRPHSGKALAGRPRRGYNGGMKAQLALCCVMLTACGGAAGAGRAATAGAPAPRDENVITEDELRSRSSFNLYDAIRALRPRWLRRNPTALRPSAEGDIVVYVDRARMGGLAALRDILPSEAQLVRYYSPSQAEAEFGPGHLHGAIQVITSRGR